LSNTDIFTVGEKELDECRAKSEKHRCLNLWLCVTDSSDPGCIIQRVEIYFLASLSLSLSLWGDT